MDALLYNSMVILFLLNLLLSLRNTYNLNEYRDLLYHILDHVCPFDEYGETEHDEGEIIVLGLSNLETNTDNNEWEDWDKR